MLAGIHDQFSGFFLIHASQLDQLIDRQVGQVVARANSLARQRLAQAFARDFDQIGAGRHERFVVAWDKFNARAAEKAARAVEKV